MSKEPPTNNLKFLLLLHKNWILLWHCKCLLLVELFFPAMICLLLVPVRLYKIPTDKNATTYDSKISIDNFGAQEYVDYPKHPFHWHAYTWLVYQPENPCYEKIVNRTAGMLKLGYNLAGPDFDKTLGLRYQVEVRIIFDKLSDCKKNLKYTIRYWRMILGQHNVEFNRTWMTNQLFIEFDPMGPRNPNLANGGIPSAYFRDSFLGLQHAIAKSFFEMSTQKFKDQALPTVEFQRFPYQKYKHDEVMFELAYLLPWIIMFGYMHTMMFIVWQVTKERGKQLKEIMIMSGLPNWMQWTAWFVRALVIMGLSALLVAIVLTAKWANDKYAILNNSSITAVYFFLLTYIATSITFCFMLATMFSKASTAVVVAVVVWFVTFLPFIPYSILADYYVNMTFLAKLMWTLIPNTALNFGIRVINGFVIQDEGLYWSNMFDPVNSDDSLSIGVIIIAMLVSSCIYMLISLYLEQMYYIGNYGVPRKWDFPFEKAYWFKKRVTNSKSTEQEFPESFESEPVGRPVGIKIINLEKSYGYRDVVKRLSMNVYEDQITVLLGHNSDGKTTVIAMMAGIITPTSGTVIINGNDINTNLKRASMSLGICPRNDILFDELTVKQHLIFYSRLRGLKGKVLLDMEIKKYLTILGLEKHGNVVSSKLSKGEKRMLSLGTALCGGSKVILCDKFTSGLDPAAKKKLWKLLKSERKGRTILVTTNFMDEADLYGDRIAIMCDGELKCMGTLLFLIKKFGDGFKLTILKRRRCHTSAEVTAFLNQYIPGIKPTADVVTELSYHLPSKYASQFPTMLEELENESNTLKIDGFDISMISLEEVFMKVGTENASNVALSRINEIRGSDCTVSPTSSNLFLNNQQLLRGPKLIVNQWQAMLWKKKMLTCQNNVLFAIQNLLPICVIVLALLIMSLMSDAKLPPLTMDLNRYRETVTVLETSSGVGAGSMAHEISSNFKAIIKSESSNHQLEDIGSKKFSDHMLELGKTQQAKIDTKYIAAASIDNGHITAWLNNEPLHSAPLTLNLIHNAMAKTLIGPEASISVTNHPRSARGHQRAYSGKFHHNDGTSFAVNYGFCMSIVTALYAINVIKEKQSRSKLLQFTSGVDVLTYWISHFIWDFTTFAFTCLLTIITLLVCQEDGLRSFFELGRIFIIILLFGCAALPLTYIVASFFIEPAAGMAFLVIYNIINGPFIFYIVQFMKKPAIYVTPDGSKREFQKMIEVPEKNWPYYPHFALSQALKKMYYNSQCWKYCQDIPYLQDKLCYWYKECCPLQPYLSNESNGIIPEVKALLITTIVCFLLLILTEYISILKLWDTMRGIYTKLTKPQSTNKKGNQDVEDEKLRVEYLSRNDSKRTNLVIKKLTKYYGSRVAVNQIYVGIKNRECFGLFGVKGAGKTTVLKMLTGEERISSGNAFVKGLSVKWRMNTIHRKIGYCPQQYYGFFDNLTGRQNLHLYALIRGIPQDKVSLICLQLAIFIGFLKQYCEPVREYSSLNKHKLSIARAMLGEPSVVYLDEPTIGMDPVSRRNVWNMICKVRDTGSSIVLASHSMTECEALCNRFAFMVNGEFQHIGSTQYTKSRLIKGLILKIKMRRKIDVKDTDASVHSDSDRDSDKGSDKEDLMADSTQSVLNFIRSKYPSECELEEQTESDNDSDTDQMTASTQKVLSFIRSIFPCAVLKESYQEFLVFYIPLENKWWSKIFNIDANKDSLEIEGYTIRKLMY